MLVGTSPLSFKLRVRHAELFICEAFLSGFVSVSSDTSGDDDGGEDSRHRGGGDDDSRSSDDDGRTTLQLGQRYWPRLRQ